MLKYEQYVHVNIAYLKCLHYVPCLNVYLSPIHSIFSHVYVTYDVIQRQPIPVYLVNRFQPFSRP